MILTLTIDTHPHTNALIEGQVKRAVEDLLRVRRLGVLVDTVPGSSLDALTEASDHNAQVADRLRKAINVIEVKLEEAEALLVESNTVGALEKVQAAILIAKES